MNRPSNAATPLAARLLAAVLLLALAAPAIADQSDSPEVAQARQRIAGAAKDLLDDAIAVKKELLLGQVQPDDVPLDLIRYATYCVAGNFFSNWAADKNLTRPDSPRCFFEDGAPAGSLAMQIAKDEFLIGFIEKGHLYDVTAGIAEQICKTFGPQIIRPMIEQAQAGLPASTAPAPPAAPQ